MVMHAFNPSTRVMGEGGFEGQSELYSKGVCQY